MQMRCEQRKGRPMSDVENKSGCVLPSHPKRRGSLNINWLSVPYQKARHGPWTFTSDIRRLTAVPNPRSPDQNSRDVWGKYLVLES